MKLSVLLGLVLTILLLGTPQQVQAESEARIIVNLPSRTVDYYEQDQLIQSFPAAIGKAVTPTPLGDYTVQEKEEDPIWYPPNESYSVPSGPANPLGYRWLGFSGNYGIHGTNEPDSIGEAVSNGCVRMQEADVERLFEEVAEGTPIRVTYERIRLLVDREGVATLGIYPDIYGRQDITLNDVRKKLREKHLAAFLSEEELIQLLGKAQGRQVPFARVHHLEINQRMMPDYAVTLADQLLVPIKAFQDYVPTARDALPAVAIGSDWYLSYDYIPQYFGGKSFFEDAKNCVHLALPAIYFNGVLLSQKVTVSHGEAAIPLTEIGRALGLTVTYHDIAQIAKIGWYGVPYVLIDGEPYIQINRLMASLNIESHFDEVKQVYNLTYPAVPIDYSGDIGVLADFTDK
jgi:L,D-transpeptidase ErfK/SrfK